MRYYEVVTTTVTIYAVLAVSLNIVVGYAGQPNLGQAAFFGLGAYVAAALAARHGVSFWLCLPAALATGCVAGLILGAISLRLREDFLAVTTIGINFVVVAMFAKIPFFGGAVGIYAIPLPSIGSHQFSNLDFAVAAIVMLIVTIAISAYVQRTWLGAALAAIKDDELAAASVGTPVARYKIAAFVLSTSLAAAVGALYAFFLSVVTPDSFGFTESIVILAMLMLGGVGTIRGAVVGAAILGALPEAFRFISNYRLLAFGTILVLMLRFQPQGLVGEHSVLAVAAQRLRDRLRPTSEPPTAVKGLIHDDAA